MVDFNKAPCIYWPDSAKISYLQRRVIIYSIMYYELDNSCISDKEYDKISNQLVKLQNRGKNGPLKESQYYYCMYDFDGTTGFDIYSKLTDKDREYLTHLARVILRLQGGM